MSEKSGFFNANLVGEAYDKVYNAGDFANYFANFIGNGIFSPSTEKLMVQALDTPNMTVNIKTGVSFYEGYWYENSSIINKTISASDSTLSRIDLVVIAYDFDIRDANIKVIQGTPAASPVVPDLIRSSVEYDLGLAKINVDAGLSTITQANIVDLRMDSNYCGAVTGLIDQVAIDDVNISYQTYVARIQEVLQNALDGTIAGHLQNEIDAKAVVAYYTATIGTTWVDQTGYFTQDVTVTGLLATDKPVVDYVPTLDFNADVAADYGNIYKMMASANTLTIYSKEISTNVIPIQIMVVR